MKLDRVIAVRNNKTVFRDGKRCVKIFSSEFSKTAVFAEALNHARVEECIDFVPRLLEVIRHDRNWAIVYEFVKGKTFLRWIEEEPEALSAQVSFFVELQERIHKTEGKNLGNMKEIFIEKILQTSLDPCLKYALHKGLEKKHFSSRLCHMDFVPSNIIIDSAGKASVIDWAAGVAGEPLADAALTWLIFKIRGLDAFAEEYRKAYLLRMQAKEEDLEEWIPYVAAFRMTFSNESERNALLPYVKIINEKGEKE